MTFFLTEKYVKKIQEQLVIQEIKFTFALRFCKG